jgi:microcystin-dependent protein
MTEVYVGQIMMTGFGFAPRSFASCNGQLLAISQNQALFALLGVQFGGNGSTNFALPNLQGQAPVGAGASVDPNWQPSPYVIGTVAGVESVTLLPTNLPTHTHLVGATTTPGTTTNPTNNIFAAASVSTEPVYGAATQLVPLYSGTLAMNGGGVAHQNMQPFRVINFNIALSGVFPSRN